MKRQTERERQRKKERKKEREHYAWTLYGKRKTDTGQRQRESKILKKVKESQTGGKINA